MSHDTPVCCDWPDSSRMTSKSHSYSTATAIAAIPMKYVSADARAARSVRLSRSYRSLHLSSIPSVAMDESFVRCDGP